MTHVNSDDFISEDIIMPPRSKLYNIEPIGLGTPYSESLTSYISRLAESHCTNVATLICKTFISYIKTVSRKKSFMNGSLGPKTKYINGNSPISLEYVTALEELTTRNDLVYLTMNSWSGLFSNNVIGDYRKWCPNCLDDAKNKGREIYEPIIWYIKDIQLCDVHQVNLEERCLKCGRNQNFLHANFKVGYCQYCLSWLGYESKILKVDNLVYQDFLLGSFKSLIVNSSNLNTCPTNLRLGFSLKKILDDNNFSSIKEFADYLGFHQSLLQQWISNKRKPSIDSLFKIYQKTHLSIYEMFGTSMENNLCLNVKKILKTKNKILTLNEVENELKMELKYNNFDSLYKLTIAKGFDARRAKKNFPELCLEIDERNLINQKKLEEQKREEIERVLSAAMVMEPPISLFQFAKMFGTSEIKAKYYCKELTNKLINRHKSYVKKQQTIRAKNIENEIKKVVLELHNSGIYPSQTAIKKKLANPNCLADPGVWRIWKKELELLELKR